MAVKLNHHADEDRCSVDDYYGTPDHAPDELTRAEAYAHAAGGGEAAVLADPSSHEGLRSRRLGVALGNQHRLR